MDAFKLLSRSTKLARKPAWNPTLPTPSSGQNANPQLFGRSTDEAQSQDDETTEVKSGRKRKRGAKGSGTVVESLPAELDFFGAGPTGDQAQKQEGGQPEQKRSNANGADEKEDGGVLDATETEDQPLGEEERRRILKTHKLKITVLEEPAEVEQDRADKKKSKKRKKDRDADAERKSKKTKTALFPQPLTDFRQLRSRYGISRRVAENVDAQGYTLPTEVQLGSLPLLLDAPNEKKPEDEGSQEERLIHGGVDILTIAPTGSGKTLAFLVPIVHAIQQRRRTEDQSEYAGPLAVVLAPTKELAAQITNEGRKLTARTGIKVSMMRKGMSPFPAVDQAVEGEQAGASDESSDDAAGSDLDQATSTRPSKKNAKPRQIVKADIIVSTPLTLLNSIKEGDGVKPLESVRSLVLDEADVLLDPLFREQTVALWNACTNPDLRLGLWSATMGSNIEELAKSTITSRWESFPSKIRKAHPRKPLIRLVVGLKDSAIPNISHQLTFAATEQGKLLALRQLLHPTAPSIRAKNEKTTSPTLRPPFLVFTQTIPRAVALHAELRYDIPPEAGGSSRIAVLHADLSDNARDDVMTRFRKGEVWVLITTDLLARGVDFRGVNGVVNYDFPTSTAAYVHRVGRTGRAGREGGVAVTLYTKEDVPFVKNIANVIAASEKMKGGQGGEGNPAVQQWLLDALPTPSKRDKQMLKKRGIEARRPNAGKEGLKARISTKSGFDRKMEHNRKGVARHTSSHHRSHGTTAGGGESEFEGFVD